MKDESKREIVAVICLFFLNSTVGWARFFVLSREINQRGHKKRAHPTELSSFIFPLF